MKIIAIITLVFIPVLGFAYTWMEWGPTGIDANDFYVKEVGLMIEVICAENGLYIWEDDGWEHYDYGLLPVIDAVDHQADDFLVVMGCGTYSDGIYTFNLNSHEFTVREWCYFPNFIKYCASNGKYYAGDYYGLKESTDGIVWNNVEYFNNINCVDLGYYQNHLIVSELSNIAEVYCSDDYGDNWITVTGTPFIQEMVYFYSGTVYGIFPDFSYSSGIWSSNDHGNNWIPEIYTTNLNSIAQDCDNNIFVGWADFPIGQRDVGVAWFDRSTQQLVEMNEDLPCFAVNQLTTHPVIDCINIVACTEYGVYLLTDYQMDVDDDLPPLQIVLFNSPNPFNPETNIYLESQSGLNGNIEIYNMKGQIIRLLPVFSPCCSYSVTWDGKTDDQRRVTSGVYFYRYVSGSEATDMKKMVMIK